MRKLNLKSLACFIMGIALIAIVVPITPFQCALAQTVTKANHYCKVTAPHVTETPVDVLCDYSKGDCNEKSKLFIQDTHECLSSGVEAGTCHEWMGPTKWRRFPIDRIDGGKFATELGLSAAAGALCFIGSLKLTPLGASVVSVVCAGVAYAVIDLNPCIFANCKVDWTKETLGPNRTHCF